MKIRAEPQGSYFIGICAGATGKKIIAKRFLQGDLH